MSLTRSFCLPLSDRHRHTDTHTPLSLCPSISATQAHPPSPGWQVPPHWPPCLLSCSPVPILHTDLPRSLLRPPSSRTNIQAPYRDPPLPCSQALTPTPTAQVTGLTAQPPLSSSATPCPRPSLLSCSAWKSCQLPTLPSTSSFPTAASLSLSLWFLALVPPPQSPTLKNVSKLPLPSHSCTLLISPKAFTTVCHRCALHYRLSVPLD